MLWSSHKQDIFVCFFPPPLLKLGSLNELIVYIVVFCLKYIVAILNSLLQKSVLLVPTKSLSATFISSSSRRQDTLKLFDYFILYICFFSIYLLDAAAVSTNSGWIRGFPSLPVFSLPPVLIWATFSSSTSSLLSPWQLQQRRIRKIVSPGRANTGSCSSSIVVVGGELDYLLED